MGTDNSIRVGIDDIAIHFPKLYMDMRDFADLRGADYGKLNKGLGLKAMAIPDVHEDTATMGANAVMNLIDRNGIDPKNIGRMYLGTESALDGAKPTATYILDMLTQRYSERYGKDCLRNCDVVDMTFACIGAVDALHTTLDWVARSTESDERIGIVIFSDNAKVLYISTHQYPYYPGSGTEKEKGKFNNIFNIPLEAGTSSEQYLNAYENVLKKIKEFKPEFILFSAGFDAHQDDPLAQFQLKSQDFYTLTKRTLELSKLYCKGKVVSILEGGYDLRALQESTQKHVEALIEFN